MYRCLGRTFFVCASFAALSAAPAWGQVLYSQNFDVDDTANWTLADGAATDESADYFFDYSTVGIPAAPNATGGTTRGMKIQANITGAVFGGSSASPNGQSFTGDYKVTFDWWHNYLGGDPAGVGVIGTTTGSTMLSTFGIETSGTFSNSAGFSDSIFFAATGDVSSSAFRAYSSERTVSYQLPHNLTVLDGVEQPIDSHATYHAGTRSNNPATGGGLEVYYQNAFPSVTVPAGQTTHFPETQHGMTVAGSTGFAWHEVEIAKIGNTVTWTVDGTLLMTIDKTNFVGSTAGTNILFGHADINAGISADPYYPFVAFTLIDNVSVSVAAAPVDADFDGDGDVDGDDFLTWQQGNGISDGSAANEDGDANGDGNVNAADLDAWKGAFPTAVAAGGAVPEPATSCGAAVALLALAAFRRRAGRN